MITDVPDDAKLMTEEPSAQSRRSPLPDLEEAIKRANWLPVRARGLCLHRARAQTATAISDAMESGMVDIDSVVISTPETPFGGIKETGNGSEDGGSKGLRPTPVTKFSSGRRDFMLTKTADTSASPGSPRCPC